MYDGLVLSLTTFDLFPPPKRMEFGKILCYRKNRSAYRKIKCYWNAWPFLNGTNGYLYQFFPEDGEFVEDQCCDDMFEFFYSYDFPTQTFYPHWHEKSKTDEGEWISRYTCDSTPCCKIKLFQKYQKHFEEFLFCMVQRSPIGHILFLCRGDNWPTPNNMIVGSVPLTSFVSSLANGEIYTDICYCIHG